MRVNYYLYGSKAVAPYMPGVMECWDVDDGENIPSPKQFINFKDSIV